jgi:copper chaperone CopZ
MVEKQNDQAVTARLNDIYGPKGEDSSLDPILANLQQRTLNRRSKHHSDESEV